MSVYNYGTDMNVFSWLMSADPVLVDCARLYMGLPVDMRYTVDNYGNRQFYWEGEHEDFPRFTCWNDGTQFGRITIHETGEVVLGTDIVCLWLHFTGRPWKSDMEYCGFGIGVEGVSVDSSGGIAYVFRSKRYRDTIEVKRDKNGWSAYYRNGIGVLRAIRLGDSLKNAKDLFWGHDSDIDQIIIGQEYPYLPDVEEEFDGKMVTSRPIRSAWIAAWCDFPKASGDTRMTYVLTRALSGPPFGVPEGSVHARHYRRFAERALAARLGLKPEQDKARGG